MTTELRTILIIDNQPLFADGLRSAAESTGQFRVTKVVSRCAEALHEARTYDPDVIVLSDPFRTSLLARLRRQSPSAQILLLTGEGQGGDGHGPSPTLSRRAGSPQAVALLRSLARLRADLDETRDDPARQDVVLTGREKDVLGLVASGYTSAEIGGMLFLSTNTVRTYCQSSLRKLGARNRMQAVAIARRMRVLD